MQEAINYYLTAVIASAMNWFIGFFYFWLVEGPKSYWKKAFQISVGFEEIWATFTTLSNFFSPLYQDYSITGRILGPFFRLGRFFAGIAVHLILLSIEMIGFFIFALIFWGAPVWFLANLFIW